MDIMKRTSIYLLIIMSILLLTACGTAGNDTGEGPISEEHIHSFGEWETVKESTCLEAGSRQRLCQCGEKETEEIEILPHTEVIDEAIDPTCSAEGKTEGKHCSVCNTVTVAQETVSKLPHTEVIDEAVAATCTAEGKTEGKHCSVCNTVTVAQETVSKLPHTEVIDEAVAATCTAEGKTEGKHCSVCNTVTVAQEKVSKLSHTEVIDKAVAATCTKEGKTEGKHCSVCNTVTVAQEKIAKLPHTEVIDKAVAATCSKEGKTEGKHCSVCNTVTVKQEKIAKLPHTEVVDKGVAATCTSAGKSDGKHCTVCNTVTVKQETVKALGHSYSAWVRDNDSHERKCSRCNTEEKGKHTYSARNECTKCGFGYKDYITPTADRDTKYTIENLGSFTKTTYIRMNGGGYRKDGTPVIYFVGDGIPNAMFVMANAETGELILEKKLEHSQGAWEVFVHSSKDVYIVGHATPYLYVFDYETEELRNIGTLPNGSSLGQVMCETKDGRLFSGSTDSKKFWGYDPKTGRFIDIPALISNATRYPAAAYDPVEDMLYVSVISRDSKNYLFKVDPHTFAKTDVTPSAYKNNAAYQFYDMKVFGDILFIRYPGTLETLFLNIRTNKLVAFNKAGSTGNPTVIKTYCRQPAADPENSKNFYTIMENQLALFDTEKLTYTLTGVSCPDNQMIRMVMLKLKSKTYTGYSACSIYSHKGKMQFSNFTTKKSVVFNTTFDGSPNDINCLTITESGKIIVGGNYGGSTGVYDITTGQRYLYQGLSQQEGVMAYGDKVVVGTYPNANLYIVDTASGWKAKHLGSVLKNASVAGYHNQDRPYTMLPIYDKGITVVGTIPAQSFTTGAIAFISMNSGTVSYLDKFPIAGQSASAMAYTNGKLYMGTTTRAGYGTAAVSTQAYLLAMDMDTKKCKTYSLPFNALAITAMTVAEDGKIWGMAYDYIFSFDPVREKFDYYRDINIHCSNQTWREFKMTMGADGSCIFISGAVSKDFYRFDLNTKRLDTIAEDVGWHHVMDNYGNFYFMKGTELYKLTFKY